MQKVVNAELHSGGTSIFRTKLPLGSVWELLLECGCVVMRKPRYKPASECERPYMLGRNAPGWYSRRFPEDVLPAQKRAKCKKHG